MSSNEEMSSEKAKEASSTPLAKIFKKCKSATFQIDGQTYTIGKAKVFVMKLVMGRYLVNIFIQMYMCMYAIWVTSTFLTCQVGG